MTSEEIRGNLDVCCAASPATRVTSSLVVAEENSTRLSLISFGIKTASGWTSSRFSIELSRGETLALIGPSGSGKTLILEQFVGALRPGIEKLGQARIGRIAWVPQDARLAVLPTDRVWSLVGLSGLGVRLQQATGRRPSLSEDETCSVELLRRLRLDPDRLAELPFRDLSATERRCVLVAQALLMSPEILVIDGWGEQMDGPTRRAVAEVLRERISAGLCVVLTSRRYPLLDFNETRVVTIGEAENVDPPVPLLQKAASADPHAHVLLEVNRLTVERKRRGLLRRRPPAVVIDGASLFVRHGESLAVLGVAGSGKSTLFEAISGLIPASRGTVRVEGNDITQARGRRARRLRQQVQLVFQDAASVLDGQRTVQALLEEAMSLGKGLRGSPSEWMERLGLSPRLLQAPADQLSASESQRVDFARSLVVSPKLILFDAPEVSGAGDDGGILAALFLAEKSRGRAFLVATNKPELARSLADRVAVLHAGRIIEMGPAKQVLARPGHPLTLALLCNTSIPEHDPTSPKRGCPFVSQCERRQLPKCDQQEPMLAPLSFPSAESEGVLGARRVACFHPLVD